MINPAQLRKISLAFPHAIERPHMEAREDLRLACTHVTRSGADICRNLYELGGGVALFETSPLQRQFRDAQAATQHIVTAPATWELTGRILFGLPTDGGMV